ncbi:MAG: Pycsar system effector family protein [Cyclobacteriaceae bacterium]
MIQSDSNNPISSTFKVSLPDPVSPRTKPPSIFSRETLNIIRTTKRNNIDLKNIADNKANILMSLNALMITFLIPIVLSHREVIVEEHLYIPLLILVVTCFTTIFICAVVLKPFNLKKNTITTGREKKLSPFFFGNYYRMKPDDYLEYIQETVEEPQYMKEYLFKDLYFIGKTLGVKYNQIRNSYLVFMIGLGACLLSTVLVLVLL